MSTHGVPRACVLYFQSVKWTQGYPTCAQQKNRQLPGSRAPLNRSAESRECVPGPSCSGEKSQLEPSRDGENMRRGREEPIQDMMKEDQRPTKWEDYYHCLPNILRKWLVVCISLVTIVFFFQENKSFGAPPFALILCQYSSWYHVWNTTCEMPQCNCTFMCNDSLGTSVGLLGYLQKWPIREKLGHFCNLIIFYWRFPVSIFYAAGGPVAV